MRLVQTRVILILLFFLSNILHGNKADLVVFSYDRPLQLYALLESAHMYLEGLGKIVVIYRASNERYQTSYDVVKKEFNNVRFVQQGTQPRTDFKPLTVSAVCEQTPNEYLMFAVDDIIVKDFINIPSCIAAMQKTNAYGFYFRMGKHLNNCYSMNQPQEIPPFTKITDDVCAWTFAQGQHDWGYPNTVDMTLYRKKDIEHMIRNLHYEHPNSLEGSWAGMGHQVMHRTALCHTTTKVVNVPLNRVQHTHHNRHMDAFSAQELLELFEQGFKIDIHDLYKVSNKSAHMEYAPKFVHRLKEELHDGSKHFVIIAASYKNKDWYAYDAQKKWPGHLDSIFAQTYQNYHLVYVDDCSPDETGNLVERYVQEHGIQDRVTLIKNTTRYGAMENQYRALHACKDAHVAVILDGDDAFAHQDVLTFLNRVYTETATWLTYGQFTEYPHFAQGFCCAMPADIVARNAFREFSHIPSHLRTFYAGLFNQIKREDLMYQGEFLKMDADIAAMFPMIEMAREGHFCFIPYVLCIYNGANVLNDHKISKAMQRELDLEIRSRKRYAPAKSYVRG